MQMSRGTALQVTEKCTYHRKSPNIAVCELISERGGESNVLQVDGTLSKGLGGIVSVSPYVSGDNRD